MIVQTARRWPCVVVGALLESTDAGTNALSVSVYLSVCLCLSLSVSLCVCLCLCLSLSLSLCLCLSVSVCLSPSVSVSLCLPVSLCVTVSVSLSFSLSLSLSLSVCLSLCLSVSVCLCLCLSLSLSLFPPPPSLPPSSYLPSISFKRHTTKADTCKPSVPPVVLWVSLAAMTHVRLGHVSQTWRLNLFTLLASEERRAPRTEECGFDPGHGEQSVVHRSLLTAGRYYLLLTRKSAPGSVRATGCANCRKD